MINVYYSPNKISSLLDYNTVHVKNNDKGSELPRINFEYSKIEKGFEIVSVEIIAGQTVRCIQEPDLENRWVLIYFWLEGLAITENTVVSDSKIHKNDGIYMSSSIYPVCFENISSKTVKGFVIALQRSWIHKRVPEKEVANFCMKEKRKIKELSMDYDAWKYIRNLTDNMMDFPTDWYLGSVGWSLVGLFFSQLKNKGLQA